MMVFLLNSIPKLVFIGKDCIDNHGEGQCRSSNKLPFFLALSGGTFVLFWSDCSFEDQGMGTLAISLP